MFCSNLASSIGHAKPSRVFSWLFNVAQLGLRSWLFWPKLSIGLAGGEYLELRVPVISCVSSIWSPPLDRKGASFWHHDFLLWKSQEKSLEVSGKTQKSILRLGSVDWCIMEKDDDKDRERLEGGHDESLLLLHCWSPYGSNIFMSYSYDVAYSSFPWPKRGRPISSVRLSAHLFVRPSPCGVVVSYSANIPQNSFFFFLQILVPL